VESVEAFLALDLQQLIPVPLAGGVPAPARKLDISSDVFLAQQVEPRFFGQALRRLHRIRLLCE
jgi:hypothetical protein